MALQHLVNVTMQAVGHPNSFGSGEAIEDTTGASLDLGLECVHRAIKRLYQSDGGTLNSHHQKIEVHRRRARIAERTLSSAAKATCLLNGHGVQKIVRLLAQHIQIIFCHGDLEP
jgi:hypothetical protein